MEATRRFSILPFPQLFKNGALALNIVVLPRNQNPLEPAIAGSAAFADAALSLKRTWWAVSPDFRITSRPGQF